MLYPLSFALGRSGSQLKAAKNLAKAHSYLGHGERRTETAAIAAAEREPGRGSEGGAEHPARVEAVGVGVLLRAGVYQPDARSDHDAGRQAVARQLDGLGQDPADIEDHRADPQRFLRDRVEVLVARRITGRARVGSAHRVAQLARMSD